MILHLLWTAIDQLWSDEGMISYKQCILIQEMAHGHGSHGQQKFRRISRLQISCQSFQVNQFLSKQNKYSRNATLMLCRIIIKSLSLFCQGESRRGSFEFFLWLLLSQDWVACQFFNYSCIPLSRLSLYSFMPVLKEGGSMILPEGLEFKTFLLLGFNLLLPIQTLTISRDQDRTSTAISVWIRADMLSWISLAY